MAVVNRAKIKTMRQRAGLTLAVAASKAGFSSHVQWMSVENGTVKDPQVSTVARIAKVLGCPVADLIAAGASRWRSPRRATPRKGEQPR